MIWLMFLYLTHEKIINTPPVILQAHVVQEKLDFEANYLVSLWTL
jgi:hypothetical protein